MDKELKFINRMWKQLQNFRYVERMRILDFLRSKSDESDIPILKFGEIEREKPFLPPQENKKEVGV